MGTLPTDSFSVTNLVQSLTGAGSPQLAATLSTPAVQTAIQNAPTSDLVDLSSQALKLQETDLLFGDGSANPSAADTATLASTLYPLSALLAAADAAANKAPQSGASAPSPTATSSTASLADQLTGYQNDLQAQEIQSLFGIAPTVSPPNLLVDTLG
ncbi:MAG: hypothetical protein ABSG03_34260 [Bryobacteraceae bacterium]|jgi:hypothetical protein